MSDTNELPKLPLVWVEQKTLRDEFAMVALQGWLSSYGPNVLHPEVAGDQQFRKVAESAYKLADAMIEVREKK